jgi:putative tricarboxylic transport membrane protein
VTIRNPKDFWSGLLFLVVGGTTVLLAQQYPLGTAFRMGPGYFPMALGGLLALVGLLAMARSFIRHGTAIEPFHWRLLLMVTGSAVLFGLLVRGAGLSVAAPALVLVTAAASVYFRWRTALILAVGLTVLSALLFVKGLGLPIPLIGPWFGD